MYKYRLIAPVAKNTMSDRDWYSSAVVLLKMLERLRTLVIFLNASTIQLYDLFTPTIRRINNIKTTLKTQFSLFAAVERGLPSYLTVVACKTVSFGTAGVSENCVIANVSGISVLIMRQNFLH